MKIEARKMKTAKRGRPAKQQIQVTFNPNSVKLMRGSDLQFSEALFKPKIGRAHV